MPAPRKDQIRTRKQDKARQARADAKARKACVVFVWERDRGCCQKCGVAVYTPSLARCVSVTGHVHEVVPRSRGGDPHDPAGCVLMCAICHGKAHRLKFGSTV